jgi:hypothetical protein
MGAPLKPLTGDQGAGVAAGLLPHLCPSTGETWPHQVGFLARALVCPEADRTCLAEPPGHEGSGLSSKSVGVADAGLPAHGPPACAYPGEVPVAQAGEPLSTAVDRGLRGVAGTRAWPFRTTRTVRRAPSSRSMGF